MKYKKMREYSHEEFINIILNLKIFILLNLAKDLIWKISI